MVGGKWITDRFDKMEAETLPFFDNYGDWECEPVPKYECLGDVGKFLKEEEEQAFLEKSEMEKKAKLNKKLVIDTDSMFDYMG